MTTLAVIGIGLAVNVVYVAGAYAVHRWMHPETFTEWLSGQPEEDGGKPR